MISRLLAAGPAAAAPLQVSSHYVPCQFGRHRVQPATPTTPTGRRDRSSGPIGGAGPAGRCRRTTNQWFRMAEASPVVTSAGQDDDVLLELARTALGGPAAGSTPERLAALDAKCVGRWPTAGPRRRLAGSDRGPRPRHQTGWSPPRRVAPASTKLDDPRACWSIRGRSKPDPEARVEGSRRFAAPGQLSGPTGLGSGGCSPRVSCSAGSVATAGSSAGG
jgi:hypothetical protein